MRRSAPVRVRKAKFASIILCPFHRRTSIERELWKHIVAALKRLPPTRPRNACFTDPQILAVFLWAALHDRPTSWACDRGNWPMQAWRRALPNQSTMSRRLRTDSLRATLDAVLARVQQRFPDGRVLFTDGKAFAVSNFTSDPDAANGRSTGGFARGYRLHIVTDDRDRVHGWDVRPMNQAESVTSREIVRTMPMPRRARLLLGDAGYDSNKLYDASAARGVRLVVPRRKPGRGLGQQRHHRHRLQAIALFEQRGGWMSEFLKKKRWQIERFFAGLVTSGVGAGELPTWVRRLHRVRLWVGAKLVINAARIARLHGLRA